MVDRPPIVNVPKHVAIIMDGNGRWAQARGLPRAEGHRAGTRGLHPLVELAAKLGVEYFTIWAFSTENWGRPQQETGALIKLLGESLTEWLPELHAKGVRLMHIGNLERLPTNLQNNVAAAVELTKANKNITLVVAFDFGGRDEIVRAVRKLVAAGVSPEDITEEAISAHLDTASIPDPDLVIRTANEFRLSNFMIWEAAYSEYYVCEALWPDFDEDELYAALQSYSRRERRFGRLSPPDPSSTP